MIYVPNFPLNLISISKLILDLHCVLTFSHNFVTLQDQSTGKTVDGGMAREWSVLDIVQSFPLLSYCIVSPMSVYIYKSNM